METWKEKADKWGSGSHMPDYEYILGYICGIGMKEELFETIHYNNCSNLELQPFFILGYKEAEEEEEVLMEILMESMEQDH